MKKLILSAFCLLASLSIQAQWKFTPEAGVNVTKQNGPGTARMGFKAGMGVTYELKSSFGIKSGLYFVQRNTGWRNAWSDTETLDDDRTRVLFCTNYGKDHKTYLQLPVMAQWSWQVAPGVRLTAGVGPYVAFGIAGKIKGQYSTVFSQTIAPGGIVENPYGEGYYGSGGYGSYQEHNGLDAHYDDAQYNPFKDRGEGTRRVKGDPRFDWGGTAALGMQVKRVSFAVGYDLNLGKGWHGQNDLRLRSHTVSFTFGYTL